MSDYPKIRRTFAREHVALDFSNSPSLARQEFAADADINNIVRKFLNGEMIPQPNAVREQVDGLDSPSDFSEACEMAFERLAKEQEQSEISFEERKEEHKDGGSEQSAVGSVEEPAEEKNEA